MDCPTCGKSLATERGMRQHHTKVHGDPLPNRTCQGCETEFYDPKSRRSYCDDCDPNAGEHNGNWADAAETTTCDSCGDSFSYYPSNRDGIYCSDCVASADGLLPENPSDPGERVVVSCEHCETSLEVVPSRATARTASSVRSSATASGSRNTSSDRTTTSGKVGRSTPVGNGGESSGRRSSATATSASTAVQTATTSGGTRTSITVGPFGRSTDSRTPTRWTTSSRSVEAVIVGLRRER